MLVVVVMCLVPLAMMATTKGHDSPFHLQRIEALAAEMKLGNFFPRIYTTLLEGNGYASPLFYGDLFLLIPAALYGYCGFALTDAFAFFIALVFLMTTVSMFGCTYSITKNEKAAFCAAVMYGLSSYLCTDLIQRCALGESQAFVFVPIVFLGFYHIMYGEKRKWYFLPIGLAAMLRCHTLSAVMTVLMLLLLFIVCANKVLESPKRLIYLGVSVVAFAVLGADFIFPTLEQMASTTFLATDGYAATKWGSLASRSLQYWWAPFFDGNNALDPDAPWVPNGIGLACVVFTAIYFSFFKRRRDKLVPRLLGVSAVLLFLTTDLFPWGEIQEFVGVIQFPWRFLVFPTFLTALAAGIYFGKHERKSFNNVLMTLVIAFSLFSYLSSGLPYFRQYSKYQANGTKLEYSYKDNIGAAEYLPTTDSFDRNSSYNSKYRSALIKNADKLFSDGGLSAEMKREGGKLIVDFYNNKKDGAYLDVPLVMYKGYTATLDDGTKLECDYGFYNRVRVILDGRSDGTVTFEYTGTPIQHISRVVNILGVFGMVAYIVISKKRQRTLYCVDLDGTLMDRSGELSDAVASKTRESIASGKSVCVCTARTPATLHEKLRNIELTLPLVVLNGAAVYDMTTEEYENVTPMRAESVRMLIKQAEELDGAIFYRLRDNELTAFYKRSSGEHFDRFIEERSNEYKRVERVASFSELGVEDIVHLAIVAPSSEVKRSYDKIKNVPNVNRYYSLGENGVGIVEVNELFATKANAIEYIKKKYKYDTVVAFGNDGNDISMMKHAELSVCPENASAEISSIADVITDDNKRGSISDFLLKH